GKLARFLSDYQIERLFLPFIALRQLAEAGISGTPVLTTLHEVITAGEQLHITQDMAEWFGRLDKCTLQNQYGPSESHEVTAYTLQGRPEEWPKLPPVGRPIANARVYVLDRELRPVPIGVPGELHLGGIALGRGYLERPDLTAERFIPDPFGDKPGGRLYK